MSPHGCRVTVQSATSRTRRNARRLRRATRKTSKAGPKMARRVPDRDGSLGYHGRSLLRPRVDTRSKATAMRTVSLSLIVLALAVALAAPDVHAQDKSAYQQRSIARYLETFASLDVDRNGELSREETQGNLEFTAVFNDIDTNRDGTVTRAELDYFLAQRFAYAPKP